MRRIPHEDRRGQEGRRQEDLPQDRRTRHLVKDLVLFETRFAHWLHRALFLETLPKPLAGYAWTEIRTRRPYRLTLPARTEEAFSRLRPALRETHGVGRIVRDPDRRLRALARRRGETRVVYLGGLDPLRDVLEATEGFFWRDRYCRACGDRTCRSGSTQRLRCNDLAVEIGALDEIEILDILRIYRRGAGNSSGRSASEGAPESLDRTFDRIAEMHDLRGILRDARPRWPDAFQ